MKIIKTNINIKTKDELNLYCVKDLVEIPNAVFIIIHGVAEYLGRYDYVVAELNKANISVYRFDNRGHGNSDGQIGHLNDFKDYIEDTNLIVDLVKLENPNIPIFILGHSMGGFIAILYGIKYQNKINGMILSAATTGSPDEVKGIKGKFVSLANSINPNIYIKNDLSDKISRNKEVVEKYKNDILVFKKATIGLYYQFLIRGMKYLTDNQSQFVYPCLILHGGDDKIIDSDMSQKFYENIGSKDKTIKIYSELYHEIFNEKEKEIVMNDVLNWVSERI